MNTRTEQQLLEYVKMAKENKNVNLAALMENALSQDTGSTVSSTAKRRAYLVSIITPPFGLLYAFKYFLSGSEKDARKVAWTCALLTCVALLIMWFIAALLLNGSKVSVQDLQQTDIQDTLELIQ